MAGAYERKSAPWQFWEKERPVIHSMKLAISSLCQIAVMGLWGKENTINSPNSMYSIYIHRNKINAIFATRSGDTVRFSPSPRALWWAPSRPDENGLQPRPGSGVPAEGGRWQGRQSAWPLFAFKKGRFASGSLFLLIYSLQLLSVIFVRRAHPVLCAAFSYFFYLFV